MAMQPALKFHSMQLSTLGLWVGTQELFLNLGATRLLVQASQAGSRCEDPALGLAGASHASSRFLDADWRTGAGGAGLREV